MLERTAQTCCLLFQFPLNEMKLLLQSILFYVHCKSCADPDYVKLANHTQHGQWFFHWRFGITAAMQHHSMHMWEESGQQATMRLFQEVDGFLKQLEGKELLSRGYTLGLARGAG